MAENGKWLQFVHKENGKWLQSSYRGKMGNGCKVYIEEKWKMAAKFIYKENGESCKSLLGRKMGKG